MKPYALALLLVVALPVHPPLHADEAVPAKAASTAAAPAKIPPKDQAPLAYETVSRMKMEIGAQTRITDLKDSKVYEWKKPPSVTKGTAFFPSAVEFSRQANKVVLVGGYGELEKDLGRIQVFSLTGEKVKEFNAGKFVPKLKDCAKKWKKFNGTYPWFGAVKPARDGGEVEIEVCGGKYLTVVLAPQPKIEQRQLLHPADADHPIN